MIDYLRKAILKGVVVSEVSAKQPGNKLFLETEIERVIFCTLIFWLIAVAWLFGLHAIINIFGVSLLNKKEMLVLYIIPIPFLYMLIFYKKAYKNTLVELRKECASYSKSDILWAAIKMLSLFVFSVLFAIVPMEIGLSFK